MKKLRGLRRLKDLGLYPKEFVSGARIGSK